MVYSTLSTSTKHFKETILQRPNAYLCPMSVRTDWSKIFLVTDKLDLSVLSFTSSSSGPRGLNRYVRNESLRNCASSLRNGMSLPTYKACKVLVYSVGVDAKCYVGMTQAQ